MKKYKNLAVKSTACILSAAMLLGSGFSAAAAGANTQKDENIYVNLQQDGSVDGIYVVNSFRLETETDIVDYGKYDSVKNLTTDGELEKKGDTITATAPAGNFFYQGNLKTKEMPWELTIRYYLDGKEVQAEELAGKNGSLKITIHVGKNDSVDEAFFENYLLQATVTMNMDNCSNLKAAGATVGNVGTSKQLVYNIMAGQEKDIVITADILDFEMDPISFQGVPMSFDLDRDTLSMDALYDKTGEIKDAADEFSDGAAELSDGAGALKDGAADLKDGANSLKEGIESYADGAQSLGDGVDTLKDGTDDLADGATELADGISSLKEGVDQLAGGYNGEEGAAAGARKLAEGADKLKSGAGQLSDGISALVGMMQGLGSTDPLSSEQKRQLIGIAEKAGYSGISDENSINRQTLQGLSVFLQEKILGTIQAIISSGGTNPIKDSVLDKSLLEESESKNIQETEETDMSEETNTSEETGTSGETDTSEETEGMTKEETESTDAPGTDSNTKEDQGEAVTTPEQTKQPDTEKDKIQRLENKREEKDETVSNVRYEKRYNAYSLATLDYRRTNWNTDKEGEVIVQVSDTGTTDPVEALKELLAAKAGVDQSLGCYMTMEGIQSKLSDPTTQSQLKQLTEGASALKDGVASLADGAGSLADGIGQLADGTNQLQSGVSELNDGGRELADGTKDLQSGVSDLADGVKELTDASDDLKDGSGQLADGTGTLLDGTQDLVDGVGELKDGTDEFKDKSSDIDTQIDEEVDKVINNFSGSDFTPLSFVSDKNTNVNLVQFVMKTDGIKMPEEVMPEDAEEPLTFWQRLLNLFR